MITKLGLLAASEAAFKLKLFDNTAYEGRNQRPAGIIDEPFPRLLK